MSRASSSLPRILRIPRSDEADTYVLVHVLWVGSAALDLNLTATEGDIPYTGVVRQARSESHRTKSFQGSDDDWTHIMLHVLGQLEGSIEKSTIPPGIESWASITTCSTGENELVISIRRKIQAITLKLGSIILRETGEQAVELFDWAAVAVTRSDFLEQRLSTLQQCYHTAEDTINQLVTQLEELTRAKRLHEEQLITNFTQLLNEKKLKIRNQQRLLASAKTNVDVYNSHTALSGGFSEPVETSWHMKRTVSELKSDDTESEDVFESLDPERTNAQSSPIGGGGEEEKEEEEEEPNTDDWLFPTSQGVGKENCAGGHMSLSPHDDQREEKARRPKEAYDRPITNEQTPPPRRVLPFTPIPPTRRRNKLRNQQHEREESAGETDDDEL
ncbi:hypothetical protein BO70DRAFT_362696 [Aspergillus heteromorphus CBS 117.55]|uniref:DNA double-strand break repair and VJ recombination XRCC4 n=1 Tax=Aspergillus heteromorphus CBS 117.55 TaxID=1448321 RepID=A0A317VYU4_9EURO|nr:uncharacterized protein BO70DRAFT_362696 [Aspergillus heteromorphus CBS 117.55]PWY79536.1 hypothetical protein BO70DRAFT_362696 [Aspergillus heteromorphus CBS 117.55]